MLAACRVSLPNNIKEYKDPVAEAYPGQSGFRHPAMLFGLIMQRGMSKIEGG